MITPQSRYQQSGIVTRVPNSSGTFNLTVFRTVPGGTSSFSLYIWKERDRPDIVSNKTLGDPALWWAIFDINPELIYPLNIAAGTVVRIPLGPATAQATLLQ